MRDNDKLITISGSDFIITSKRNKKLIPKGGDMVKEKHWQLQTSYTIRNLEIT